VNSLSSKKEIAFEGKVELQKVIEYLEQLVASLKDGKVVVEKGREFLVLEPSEIVEIEVEAEQKKDEEKFSLELEWGRSWTTSGEPDLRISSVEPIPMDDEAGTDEAEAEEEE
jgi:amphi-Trp domain-containing protein